MPDFALDTKLIVVIAAWISTSRADVLNSLHEAIPSNFAGMAGTLHRRIAVGLSSSIRGYPQLTTPDGCGMMGARDGVTINRDQYIGGAICQNSFAGFGRKMRDKILRSMR